MGALSWMSAVLFPPPPSLFLTATSAVSLIALANAGISEAAGKHAGYSKFWNANAGSGGSARISSRGGMLLLYSPALLAGIASFFRFPFAEAAAAGTRGLLLCSAVTVHFLKRELEGSLSNLILYFLSSFYPNKIILAAEMGALSWMSAVLFPPPPSIFLTATSAVSLTALAYTGISEATGKHLGYSKFWDANAGSGGSARISSRSGMLLLYSPALLAGIVSFFGFPFAEDAAAGTRGLLLCSAVTVHFLKRVLEVLFVHKYSGHMILGSALNISLSYFVGAVSMIYAQHFAASMVEPPLDLKYIGVFLFLVGTVGNFYHHYLLANLRGENDKSYKIPMGGLFELVICPHYLFEVMAFAGFACIAQTVYTTSFFLGTLCYLVGRSYATRQWYISKFENFPRKIKSLVPFIF